MPFLRRQKSVFFRRAAWSLIAVAWLLFVASFFLPATNVVQRGGVPPGTPLAGWEAFVFSLQGLVAQPLVVLAEPRALLFLLFPFINFTMLLAPLAPFAKAELGLLPGVVLIACGWLPLLLPESLTRELFMGFYCWVGSMFLMGTGCLVVGIVGDDQAATR